MNISFEVTESCFRIMLSLAPGSIQLERVVKAQQASHIGGLVWQPRVTTLVYFLIFFSECLGRL